MNILLFTGYSGFSRRNNSLFKLVKEKYTNCNIDVVTFGEKNFDFLKSTNGVYRSVKCADHLRIKCLQPNYKPKKSVEYWEEKLNLNLSKLALSERLFVQHSHDLIYLKNLNHKEITLHVLSQLEIYNKIIQDCDIVYVYTPASIDTEILYALTKFYRKKFVCYYQCRLGYNFILTDNTIDRHSKLENIYHSIPDKDIIENDLFKNFLYQISNSKKSEQQELLFKRNKDIKSIKLQNIIRFIKNLLFYKKEHFLSPNRYQKIKINVLLKLRKYFSTKFFNLDLPKTNYVYLPLPTVPEASTLIRSPLYYDCLSLIKSLSIELPLDFKLVIKEHPGMLGKRPLDFYKKISRIYNVHLLCYNFPTDRIITNAKAVITQTGSTAMESVARGVKTITLGSTITNIIRGVFSLANVSEVGDALRSPWTRDSSFDLINELKRFALAVEKYGYVPDSETVIWTKKAFNPEIIELDKLFFRDFDEKVLSKCHDNII